MVLIELFGMAVQFTVHLADDGLLDDFGLGKEAVQVKFVFFFPYQAAVCLIKRAVSLNRAIFLKKCQIGFIFDQGRSVPDQVAESLVSRLLLSVRYLSLRLVRYAEFSWIN